MKLLFLDLETTHADVEKGGIIEVAAVVPGRWPATLPLNMNVVVQPHAGAIWDPFCVDMHEKNGLYEDVVVDKLGISYEAADFLLWKFIGDRFGYTLPNCKDDMVRIAGFSVQFDKEYLRALGFKRTMSLLSHRIIDCSTLRDVGAVCGWEYEKRAETHRALPDCYEALDFYRSFIDRFSL